VPHDVCADLMLIRHWIKNLFRQ